MTLVLYYRIQATVEGVSGFRFGSSYAHSLRLLNPDPAANCRTNTSPTFTRGKPTTYLIRFPSLYPRLIDFATTFKETGFELAVLGVGRYLRKPKPMGLLRRLEPTNEPKPTIDFCPQVTEIFRLLRDVPASVTLIDADDEALSLASRGVTDIQLETWRSQLAVREYAGSDRIDDRAVYDDIWRQVYGQNDKPRINSAQTLRVECFSGFFQNIEFGEKALDAIVATRSVMTALESEPKNSLQMLAKLVRVLRPGGKLWLDDDTFSYLFQYLRIRSRIKCIAPNFAPTELELRRLKRKLQEINLDVQLDWYGNILELTRVK